MRGLFFIGLFLIAALSFGQTSQSYFVSDGSSGADVCNPVIRPTIAAATHNWNPAGFSTSKRVMVSLAANYDLTGMAAQVDGFCIYIISAGTGAVKVKKNSASSLAGNRFIINSDMDINPGQGYRFIYDSVLNGWVSGGGYH